MTIRAYGLTVRPPPGWEARVFRRPADVPGETTHPVVHAASFPLPSRCGDFGSGAVERMEPSDLFVALLEYDEDSARTALFARRGMPHPSARDFHPQQLQRTIRGQSGAQYFFNHRGRAFCLYVVVGSHDRRGTLMQRIRALLDGLTIH